jgi:hypothetical protein
LSLISARGARWTEIAGTRANVEFTVVLALHGDRYVVVLTILLALKP